MTNLEIDEEMTVVLKTERKITRRVLELVQLAEHQRLPLERGFKDTYDWLIRGHGYSGGAANRRIQAARLLREMPEVASKIESGTVNLTTLWQTQKAIRAQQKTTGQKIKLSDKKAAIGKIAGKTSEAAERELNALFPDGVKSVEKLVHKHGGGLGLFIELNAEEALEVNRARELLSHALPGATWGQVIVRLATEHNQRKDPLRKPQQQKNNRPLAQKLAAENPSFAQLCKPHLVATPQRGTAQVRCDLIQKAGAKCGFVDPITKRVCGSRYQLEIDHIVPRALGGGDEPSNLRCLCRGHNQLMAEIEFGREFMDLRRKPSVGAR